MREIVASIAATAAGLIVFSLLMVALAQTVPGAEAARASVSIVNIVLGVFIHSLVLLGWLGVIVCYSSGMALLAYGRRVPRARVARVAAIVGMLEGVLLVGGIWLAVVGLSGVAERDLLMVPIGAVTGLVGATTFMRVVRPPPVRT